MKTAFYNLLVTLHLRKRVIPTPPPKSLGDILGTFTQVQTDLQELVERKAAAIEINKKRIETLTVESAAYEADRSKAVAVTENINKLLAS
jgi:hypothetical protein